MRRSSCTISHDAPARHAREHPAARIDGGNRGVGRQAHAERLDHRRHRRRRAHRHAVAGRARHARLDLDHVRRLHLAGLQHLGELPHDACPSRCPRRGTCRSASARRTRRSSAGRTTPRPSAARAWSCRSPSAARRRRTDWRGSTPRRPSPPGCGTASWSGASASRRGSSPGTRSGSRPHRARRRARAARARGNARCTAWPATTCCRCRSPAARRTGRAGCPGSSSTSGATIASRSSLSNHSAERSLRFWSSSCWPCSRVERYAASLLPAALVEHVHLARDRRASPTRSPGFDVRPAVRDEHELRLARPGSGARSRRPSARRRRSRRARRRRAGAGERRGRSGRTP